MGWGLKRSKFTWKEPKWSKESLQSIDDDILTNIHYYISSHSFLLNNKIRSLKISSYNTRLLIDFVCINSSHPTTTLFLFLFFDIIHRKQVPPLSSVFRLSRHSFENHLNPIVTLTTPSELFVVEDQHHHVFNVLTDDSIELFIFYLNTKTDYSKDRVVPFTVKLKNRRILKIFSHFT